MPAWQQVMKQPESRWLAVYRDPGFRAALKADLDARRLAVFRGRWDLVQVLRTNRRAQGARGPEPRGPRARDGKHPVDAWLDLVAADGLDVEFLAGLLNTDEKVVGDLIVHPLTLITLSDAGAHLSLMCDAGYSSTLLGKWVRGLGRLSLEAAVKRLTDDPARAYRIPERGRLEPGLLGRRGDLRRRHRGRPTRRMGARPAGERAARRLPRARGVEWSLVNGQSGAGARARGGAGRPAGGPGQVLRRFDASDGPLSPCPPPEGRAVCRLLLERRAAELGKRSIQSAATAIVPIPPSSTAGTVPEQGRGHPGLERPELVRGVR
jgi:N-acyl-D-aspartate/D-glutamate deacylase